MRMIVKSVLLTSLILTAMAFWSPYLQAAQGAASGTPTASFLGTVESINGNQITVKNDAGTTMPVKIQDGARLLRIEPGQTSLKNASAFSLSDLQVGDRVLARGASSGNQLEASTLVAIKKTDLAQQHQKEQAAWQHGVGGLVKTVDPAAGTITIPVMPGNRTLTIDTTKQTIIRRYAPGSVKFDDAKPATLAELKPGDQVRARGTRSADGLTFTADEIVGGSFQNIAGLITAVDPSASSVTLTDLATKKPVTIEVTHDTELKKLDPAVAQRLAFRMKGPAGEPGGGPGGRAAGGPGGARPQRGPGGPGGAEAGHGFGAGAAPGQMGGGDPQQLLARAPTVPLTDFSKGNAVMLVATEGKTPGSLIAVTMVGGVEPMLQASASGSRDFLSNAWSLGSGGGGDGGDAGMNQGGGGGGGGPQ